MFEICLVGLAGVMFKREKRFFLSKFDVYIVEYKNVQRKNLKYRNI